MTQKRQDLVKTISVLHPLQFNWLTHIEFIKSHCQDHHGSVGQAIVNGEHISPPVLPKETDVNSANENVYDFDEYGELSPRGERQYDAAVARYYKLLDQHIINDVAALQFIRLSCSEKSIARAEQKSPSYDEYLQLPIGGRATRFLELLKATHSSVDIRTRQSRMERYFRQGFDEDMQSTLQTLDRAHTQFVNDLGSPPDPLQPHLIDHRIILSYNYYRILTEKPEYSQFVNEMVLRPINHTDPDALAASIMAYTIAKGTQFGNDPPSSQGQAYAAFPITPSSQSQPPSLKPNTKGSPITVIKGDPTKPHCLKCLAITGQIYNNHGDHTPHKCHRNNKLVKPASNLHSQAFVALTQPPVHQPQQQQQQLSPHPSSQHQQQQATYITPQHQHQLLPTTQSFPPPYQQYNTSLPHHPSPPSPSLHHQQQHLPQHTFQHPNHQSYLAHHPSHYTIPSTPDITPSYLSPPHLQSSYPPSHPQYPYSYLATGSPLSHPSSLGSPQPPVTLHPQTHSSFLAQPSASVVSLASDSQVAARARALVANFSSGPPSEETTALLASLCDSCD